MKVGQRVKVRNLNTFETLYGRVISIEENMFDVKPESGHWETMTFDIRYMKGLRQYTGWMIEGVLSN